MHVYIFFINKSYTYVVEWIYNYVFCLFLTIDLFIRVLQWACLSSYTFASFCLDNYFFIKCNFNQALNN